MTRKTWAILFLVIAAFAMVGFYLRLGKPRITDSEPVLSALATVAGGWGIALLIPDRFRRWAIGYMAVITPIAVVIMVVLIQAISD